MPTDNRFRAYLALALGSTGPRVRQSEGEDTEKAAATEAELTSALKFVSSAGHWAYAHSLIMLAEVINMLEAFFKSCPCHPSLAFQLRGESWSRRHKKFLELLGYHHHEQGVARGQTCPVQGCQAPFCANGKHLEIMKNGSRHPRGSWSTSSWGLAMRAISKRGMRTGR